MKLENWYIINEHAHGDIYDDSKGRFKDGTFVKTSTIIKRTTNEKGIEIIETRNSEYELGEEN